MKRSLLLADPDITLTTRLAETLEQEGFQVALATEGKHALTQALQHPFHALITELILPTLSGFELLTRFRSQYNTPVIILTASHDPLDRLLSLKYGAQAYIQKPCHALEVLTQLQALLSLHHPSNTAETILTYHALRLDRHKRLVWVHESLIELTNTEFNLLELFLLQPGHVYSKERLTEYAIGRKYTAYDRSIDVHISHLRMKLGERADGQPWISTIRGFGYALD